MRRPPGTAADGVVAAEAAAHQTVVAGDDDDDDGAEGAEPSWLDDLNPDSKRVITAFVEPSLGATEPGEVFQFERHGYFVADLRDHARAKPVYNRTVTLKDSWAQR
jgi:glutamyl/glutaminyl-tRNA synthetase